MVILILAAGTFFGAMVASVALWYGAPVLLALFIYSFSGTVGALGVAWLLYLRHSADENTSDWHKKSKPNSPVSA